MRAAQLLAASLFCLPASWLSGCERVVQPVGEYASRGGAAGSSATSGRGGAGSQAGSSGWLTDAGVGKRDAEVTVVPSEDGNCTFQALPTERHRLDMYLMVDSNLTLVAPTGLWAHIRNGIGLFARDPRSQALGAGVRYYGSECSPDAYAVPDVPIDLLSSNAEAIAESASPIMFEASEMLPALQGGIRHQRMRAATLPQWKQILVVITDNWTMNLPCLTSGQPFYSLDDLIAAASDGVARTPAVETHVIGVSNPPPFDSNFVGGLSDIAAAGGTQQAEVLALTGPALLNEALQNVRRRAQPCDYLVPDGTDVSKLGLALDGSELPKVSSVTACGQQPGFYLGTVSSPQRAFLCPDSCAVLQSSDAHQARLLAGCAPRTR